MTSAAVRDGSRGVSAAAPAKVNLCLGVGPVRPDGYHSLATVYQAIGVCDEVRAEPSSAWGVSVQGNPEVALDLVPTDESNIAVQAARALAEVHGLHDPVHLTITKNIPIAGGLAGGSADAAAALLACDALWGTRTARPELMRVAAGLGSDVPFALVGGTAIGSGRGELVMPVSCAGTCWWVVLHATEGLSTPAVYREFDRLNADKPVPEPAIPAALLTALAAGDIAALGAAMSNDLQDSALDLRPELREALAAGRRASALGALVSGSGPSCLFLVGDRAGAHELAAALEAEGWGATLVAPGAVEGAHVVGDPHGVVAAGAALTPDAGSSGAAAHGPGRG